ncbi:oleosin H2-like [Pyrus x bretschneideri]|uniref:oleosin H2-like n=1 Tax=Pyrus x bretschneideri TaxID=225117 RepID=UPI00202E53F8|nr:oleosin H2-like [Pyrus x bretschneideri]
MAEAHYRWQQPQHQGYQTNIQFDNPKHQGYQTQYQYDQQQQQNGSSASNILAIATLVPVGGTLLFLSGLTLAGTIIGLAMTTPLFVIFSPVLVPAALVIFLSVTGILTSGVFGVTALSSFSWLVRYLSRSRLPQTMGQKVQETTGYLGQKMQETAGYLGQKVQETGDFVGHKMQETGGQVGQMTKEAGQTIQEYERTQEGGRDQITKEGGRGKESGRGQEGGRGREGVNVTVKS